MEDILTTKSALLSHNSELFSSNDRNHKKSSEERRKRLVTLVRALHTHNACDVLFCWFLCLFLRSPSRRHKSTRKASPFQDHIFIIKPHTGRRAPPASFAVTGCQSFIRMGALIHALIPGSGARPPLPRNAPTRVRKLAAGITSKKLSSLRASSATTRKQITLRRPAKNWCAISVSSVCRCAISSRRRLVPCWFSPKAAMARAMS
jgi:hypothetical protein